MADPLKTLLCTPPPDVITLVGKGPSLDRYDPNIDARGTVIAINETALAIPCDYFVFLDGNCSRKNIDRIPIRHIKHQTSHDRRGFIINDEIDRLYLNSSSAAAMAIAGMWGCKKVLCVGFDSVDGVTGYAELVNGISDHADRNKDLDYRRHNGRIQMAMTAFGIQVKWFHRKFMQCAQEAYTW